MPAHASRPFDIILLTFIEVCITAALHGRQRQVDIVSSFTVLTEMTIFFSKLRLFHVPGLDEAPRSNSSPPAHAHPQLPRDGCLRESPSRANTTSGTTARGTITYKASPQCFKLSTARVNTDCFFRFREVSIMRSPVWLILLPPCPPGNASQLGNHPYHADFDLCFPSAPLLIALF